MTTLTKRQIFTYATLFVLLAVRILVADPISNFGQAFGITNPPIVLEFIKIIHDINYYLLISWCYVLAGIVIIVNRNDLQTLNIDGGLVLLYALCGLSYWKYFPWPTGWITLLVPIAMFILYKKEKFRFTVLEPVTAQTGIIIVIIFLLTLLLIWNFIDTTRTMSIINWIVYESPFVLMEELIFRSLLWRFLANLDLSAAKILVLQAFLFWISHINGMIIDPVFFWILVPIISITLGVIVWRSKSITVSFIAHMLINFLLRFR